ncbi:MAG TPA: SURF1 family cytochrome oxidase biogenesis protein [Acetobacteraceae bacterium]|nr:SURF1 family cytochrome oxidase biogenesis protein [Acetobacteraceae bacterium]
MAWRRLLVPVLIVAPVFLILIGLGTWQAERLRWKTDLLARIAAAEAAPPVPLTDPPEPWVRVIATGRFDHAREAQLGIEVRGTVLGTHLVTPLIREGAPPLLVDRGWIPLERAQSIARPEGEQRIAGYIRPGERAGLFSARDDVAGRRFYTADPAAIGAALGIPAPASYVLVALGEGTALPIPARTLPRPTNNHLGYAITWYGLALSLLGVFLAWARRRLRG